MKKLLGIILIFCNSISYAQNEGISKAKFIRIIDGDSTAFFYKKFEIDIKAKKIYIVNPVMNYLDVKGGKPKYKLNLKRENRNKVMDLISEIDLSDYEKVEFDNKNYSIILENEKGETYAPQTDKALVKLKEIIKIIRKE